MPPFSAHCCTPITDRPPRSAYRVDSAWEMRQQLPSSGVPVLRLAIGRDLSASQLRAICDAFDGAWTSLTDAGSPLAQPDRAPAAREVLAKRIIDMAETGTFDVALLREDALAYLWLNLPVD